MALFPPPTAALHLLGPLSWDFANKVTSVDIQAQNPVCCHLRCLTGDLFIHIPLWAHYLLAYSETTTLGNLARSLTQYHPSTGTVYWTVLSDQHGDAIPLSIVSQQLP